MIDVQQEMISLNLESKMLLQVHDELLFDCTNSDVDYEAKEIKTLMNNYNTKKIILYYMSEGDLEMGKMSDISDNSDLSNVSSYSGKLNTRYHESTSSFTNDGNTMYFTRNNYNKGKYREDKKGTNKLKIYRTYRKEGVWTTPEELPFNSNEYSVAHPALSADEKQLYFASDMPGTHGQSDLYVVSIHSDGSFGEPKNLGKGINTESRETFPFVSKTGELYFSSDGHAGLGGLDIYVSQLGGEEAIGDVYNVGEPVNSPYDDFTFIINPDTNLGYFASNRPGGLGDDEESDFKDEDRIPRCCDMVEVMDEMGKVEFTFGPLESLTEMLEFPIDDIKKILQPNSHFR